MMDKTDLMFKEAFEYLKPYWTLKETDIVFELIPGDPEWPLENLSGYFSWGDTDQERLKNRIEKGEVIWKAKQEDLQEIYKQEQDCNFDYMLSEFGKFIDNGPWIYYNHFHVTDFNQAWLCFIMETCFQKEWNGATWE